MVLKHTAALLLLALPWQPVFALDAIVFEAASIEVPGRFALEGVQTRLQLPDAAHSKLDLQAAALTSGHRPLLRALRIQCETPVVREPLFACARTRMSAAATPLGPLSFDLDATYRSDTRRLSASLSNFALAGGRLQLAGEWSPQSWRLHAASSPLAFSNLGALLHPWWSLPTGWTATGQAALTLDASGAGTTLQQANFALQLRAVDAENEASTYAAEKLDAALSGSVTRATRAANPPDALLNSASPRLSADPNAGLNADLQLNASAGQLLAGPALLDFNAHPTTVQASGSWSASAAAGSAAAPWAGNIDLSQVTIAATDLLVAHGQGRLEVGQRARLAQADLSIEMLRFPAAYTSFMQQTLAATDLGALKTAGTARGHLQWQSGAPQQLDLQLEQLDFDDAARKLRLAGVDASLHWRARDDAALENSRLSWQSLRAYGLEGGPAELEFRASGDDFALSRPTRLPLFDGALAIARFEVRDLAGEASQLQFDATIDPISMPLLSRALGWPQMAGTVSGRIPALAYRDHVLSIAGEMTAQIFDGTVSLRRLRLSDPLGKWPRLSGDFSARRLDLEQFTRTFPIGSITGRLDADVQGLELFDWSPIAFDAHLYTSPGDRSRHRISQRAVGNLANIGGGGGGVTAALQSGFLKFFDTFGYQRIGLRCQLRNDVCLMDGIVKPGGGFYIVQGGGLPRLDIVANSGRVAWGQLVSQIQAALRGGDVVVK